MIMARNSPCPILFEIRGNDPNDLPAAMRTVRAGPPAGWLIFETNQGTDDHVLPAPSCEPRTTVQVDRQVSGRPHTIRGGHVIVEMDGLDAAAYEPSKRFREIVRALRPGDSVRLVGSLRDEPRALHIEKLRGLSPAEESPMGSNPGLPPGRKRAKPKGSEGSFSVRRVRPS